MADHLKIKRCFFHGKKKGHPHYDIPKKRMVEILNHPDVTVIETKKLLAIIKAPRRVLEPTPHNNSAALIQALLDRGYMDLTNVEGAGHKVGVHVRLGKPTFAKENDSKARLVVVHHDHVNVYERQKGFKKYRHVRLEIGEDVADFSHFLYEQD